MEHQRSGIFIINAFQTGCSVARLFRIINNGISLQLNNGYIYIDLAAGLRIKSLPLFHPSIVLNVTKAYLGGMGRIPMAGVSYSHQYSFRQLEMSSHSHIICLLELFHFTHLSRKQGRFKALSEDQS